MIFILLAIYGNDTSYKRYTFFLQKIKDNLGDEKIKCKVYFGFG